MARSRRKKRQQYKTVLLVGEGYDEVNFLNHINSFKPPNNRKVTIKNAKGRGANGVVTSTIRYTHEREYDEQACWLDIDVGWTEAVGIQARDRRIQIIKSDACFEDVILRILQINLPYGSDKKRIVAQYLRDLPQHFSLATLQARRVDVPELDEILKFFKL